MASICFHCFPPFIFIFLEDEQLHAEPAGRYLVAALDPAYGQGTQSYAITSHGNQSFGILV